LPNFNTGTPRGRKAGCKAPLLWFSPAAALTGAVGGNPLAGLWISPEREVSFRGDIRYNRQYFLFFGEILYKRKPHVAKTFCHYHFPGVGEETFSTLLSELFKILLLFGKIITGL